MKLNFKKYGDSGDAVIILHGIFGMLDNWHSFASQLSKDYMVFTVDQRNHGRSPHSDKFSYKHMVSDLLEFIVDHKISTVKLIGHSMGGKTAMHFALNHPEFVEKLCVLDIGVKYYPPRHDEIFEALCSLDLDQFSSRNGVDEYFSKYIGSFAIRQFLIKNLKRKKDGFEWKMNLPIIRKKYEKILDWIPTGIEFEKESLFVKGQNSPYIEEEDWPGIQEIFPNAQLRTISGAGHWLHAEQPYELLKTIRSFLN